MFFTILLMPVGCTAVVVSGGGRLAGGGMPPCKARVGGAGLGTHLPNVLFAVNEQGQ